MRTRLERFSKRRLDDYLAAVRRSRRLHRSLVNLPGTEEGYLKFLRHSRRSNQNHFFITLTESEELAGMVILSEIVRGYVQSATVAYCAFTPHAGKGYVREGVEHGLKYAFDELKLHRVDASIQPKNERSRTIVQSLGFRLEGYSPRYIKISGKWCDHERWALLKEEWQPARPLRSAGPRLV